MQDPRFILASSSPRRRDLLARLHIPFTLYQADVDEAIQDRETPEHMVCRLSWTKAAAALKSYQHMASSNPDRDGVPYILAADTTVVLDGQILGKPANAAEAEEMLRALRGRAHQVMTGMALVNCADSQVVSDCAQTEVLMRSYSDAEMAAYIASGDPLDKAGAYAVQNLDFQPVAEMDGCYTNVVGLPICHIVRALRRFGVEPPIDVPDAYRTIAGITCHACETALAQPAPEPMPLAYLPAGTFGAGSQAGLP